MKVKSKNRSSKRSRKIRQRQDSKLKTPFTLRFEFCFRAFCFSFLAFLFLDSLSYAEMSSEQLDPTYLLVPHYLVKLLQDPNMPNAAPKTLQDPNTYNTGATTLQDVKMTNFSEATNALFPVWKTVTQIEKLPSIRQEHSQNNFNSLSTTTINTDAQVDKKLTGRSSTFTENQKSETQRLLWQARITIPQGQKDKKSKSELQRIIEQIRTVEFAPTNQAPEPIIVVEPAVSTETEVPTVESNKNLSDTEVLEEPKRKESDSKLSPPLPYQPVTKQTLQMLENLSQHPNQVNNPFELAEVLFLSGHLKEASVFYQEAFKRSTMDNADSVQNRAWMLFQIGNCLRDHDPPMAIKMYRQLITEYPDSPWTDLAKAQDKLIDWYQNDKPRMLIRNTILQ
ncbi:MAG: hypothetical protein AMJ43_07500 [Coxiella sp. DG_40]|nr:MAG: hypothetical protein AMJ43_07500 [Coxiella sp. DG_40]